MSEEAGGGEVRDGLTPVLRPVRAGNGFEEALEQILQVVRLGLVPGGERLPAERELAERLGISRVTLREVLKVLQDQGLVESRRGRAVRGARAGGEAGGPAARGPGAHTRRAARRVPPAGHAAAPHDRRAVRLPHAHRPVRGRPREGQRPARLHPAAGAQPGALPAAAHRPGGGGDRGRRRSGAGDHARALRGHGGAAAGVPRLSRAVSSPGEDLRAINARVLPSTGRHRKGMASFH